MSDFLENIVNQRFRLVYDELQSAKKIKSKSDIANQLGTYNHVINSILKGKRNITLDQMNKLIDLHKVNANFLFGNSNQMFKNSSANSTIPLPIGHLAFEGRKNITLVPQKAMAGYAIEANPSADYMEQFDKFSIPGVEGQCIAFEISGDSMLPHISDGDLVVCEPVERNTPIKDNAIYVIITESVVTKRVQQLKENNTLTKLRLISDNQLYPPYEVELEDVKQILRVKCKVSTYGIS